jgi:hypothetical protein
MAKSRSVLRPLLFLLSIPVILLSLGLVGYVAAGPYWLMYRLRSAIQDRDAEAIAQYVDFPKLRQSLKGELTRVLGKTMGTVGATMGNPALGALAAVQAAQAQAAQAQEANQKTIAAIAAEVASATANNPQAAAVAQSLTGVLGAATNPNVVGAMGAAAALIGATMATTAIDASVESMVTPDGLERLIAGETMLMGSPQRREPSNLGLKDATYAFESTERFVITVKTPLNSSVKLVLLREWLDWKLRAVELPQ